MLVTGLAAVTLEYSIQLPSIAGMVVQIILGITLGLTFDRSFFRLH